MARNLCVQYSIRPEVVEIFMRVSGAGVIIAPLSAPGAIITHVPNSGVYVLTIQDVFAEFLGGGVSVTPVAAPTAAVNVSAYITWNNALRQLTITLTNTNSSATPSVFTPGLDASVLSLDLDLAFADSRVA